MSNVYIQEPNTTGKVLFNTTYGDIEVELWCREAPKACRNFIQLALEGYHDDTLFHRLVPGFIVQAGKKRVDPLTNLVSDIDQDAAKSASYPGEYHSRLKFNRRGLLGAVALEPEHQPLPTTSAGKKEVQYFGNEYFFTLDKTPELDRKCTLFGRVVGDTIFNLLRLDELEIDPATEAPLYPPKINQVKVLTNPFDDIRPREPSNAHGGKESTASTGNINQKKLPCAPTIKNTKLLSFEDSADQDDTIVPDRGIKSMHDLSSDPRFCKNAINPAKSLAELQRESISKMGGTANALSKDGVEGIGEVDAYESIKQMKSDNLRILKEQVAAAQREILEGVDAKTETWEEDNAHESGLNAKIDSLGKLLGKHPKRDSNQGGEEPAGRIQNLIMNMISGSTGNAINPPTKPSIPESAQKNSNGEIGKRNGRMVIGKRKATNEDEVGTLLALNQFREKLRVANRDPNQPSMANEHSSNKSAILDICKLHGLVNCLSCRDTFGLSAGALADRTGVQQGSAEKVNDGELEGIDDKGWLMHRLIFDGQDQKYRDVRDELLNLVVIDPREKAKELMSAQSKRRK